MPARLGNVNYWTTTTIAVLIAVMVAISLVMPHRFGPEYLDAAVVGVVAALIWLADPACRYVLARR